MLTKLSIRNAKRSMKDYLIYLITMTGIAAMMFAFDSMIFSKSVMALCEEAGIMAAMIGLATFFIVLIVAWLIHYMVRFMLEKRSREFGTYLLLGMKKKQISSLYMKENIVMGFVSFILGIVLGLFLQQVLMVIFYQVFSQNYKLNVSITPGCLIMTVACYVGCYILALLRNKKMFKKMEISDFMRMDKENEKMKEGGEGVKQWLFFASILYFVFFFYQMFHGKYTFNGVMLLCVGFIISIYCIYVGFAAFLVRYIKRGGHMLYKKQNLFLFRQIASKLKTMQFTMGTLTILLTVALLGGTVAMMFAKYEDEFLDSVMPFDVIAYGADPEDDFEREKAAIEENAGIEQGLVYQIYQDGSHEMNDYLYSHNSSVGNTYVNEDGSLNQKAIANDDWAYFDYDTYMKLSDYNTLRSMLGYKEIVLKDNEYAIHIKSRVAKELNEEIKNRIIKKDDSSLVLSDIYTEEFSQNGQNGADYLLIVPDDYCNRYMTPFYANYAASLKNEPTEDLQNKLEDIGQQKSGLMTEDEYYKKIDEMYEQGVAVDEIAKFEDAGEKIYYSGVTMPATGTDQVVSIASDVLVQTIMKQEMLFVLTAVIFPLVYIGLVFLCVALTILAVQQLSDSGKYKFRYEVLRKLGLNEKEINGVILRQLLSFYMVPAVVAVLLSSVIAIFTGHQFVKYTGASHNGFSYFGISLLVFFGVYVIYFLATYIGFKRNVRE